MTTTTDAISTIQDQVLESVKLAQDTVVKAVKAWAEAGQELLPELPDFSELPLVDKLPDSAELVGQAFDFTDRIVAAQREFANAVIDAAKPLLGGSAPVVTTKAPVKKPAAV
jgi:hypothetical protein